MKLGKSIGSVRPKKFSFDTMRKLSKGSPELNPHTVFDHAKTKPAKQ